MKITLCAVTLCWLITPAGYGAIRWANELGNAFHRADFQNITFKLNSSTAGKIPGNAAAAVQAALNSWNALPNTALHFGSLGSTSAGIAQDGQNTIAFANTPDALNRVANFPAITVMYYAPDGTVTESDIILNPAFQFSTTLQANTIDLQSAITHELGHALGANHSTVSSATMFWNTLLQDNSKALLKADDAAFAVQVYPSAGAGQAYGVISGIATKDGVPLLGAGIIATDPNTGITIGGLSSIVDGSFSITVPVGNYLLFAGPITPLTPVAAMYEIPSSQPGQLQSKIDTMFKPAVTPATIQVTSGATASGGIATFGGNSAISIEAEGSVASSGSYFIGSPPVVLQSGASLDYLVSGPGLDSTITQQQVQLIGPGVTIRPNTFHLETGAKDVNGLSPLRFTIDTTPLPAPATVSVFITKGTDTALLAGGILVLPVKPSFTAASVVDGASFMGAGVSPGELVTLFGVNVGPNPGVSNSGFDPATGALSTTLGGISVTFDGIPAPLVFTSSGQVNLQVPYEVSGKNSTVVVVFNQGTMSDPVTVPVVQTQPGLFKQSGSTQVSALNQDSSINGSSNPAAKGSYVVLYGTGMGLVDPPVATGHPAPSSPLSFAPSVSVTIGGENAVIYQGGVLAPGFVGLFQVAAQVPADAPSGNVPVVLTINGQSSPGTATIAVQ